VKEKRHNRRPTRMHGAVFALHPLETQRAVRRTMRGGLRS
jgi:hypothetical protein